MQAMSLGVQWGVLEAGLEAVSFPQQNWDTMGSKERAGLGQGGRNILESTL